MTPLYIIIFLLHMYISLERESEVVQSCPSLWDRMDCGLPGSSIYGTLQARILEWVAISFSEIFPTQGLTLGLLHCRQTLYHLSHQGSPTRWLKTTEIYPVTVLEARSLKSRFARATLPLKPVGNPSSSHPSFWWLASTLCHLWFIDASIDWIRPHLNELILTWLPL